MRKIEDLQYITQDSEVLSHFDQAINAFKMGIKWVQLRMKDTPDEEIINTAEEILANDFSRNGTIIINDSVEIAKKVNAKAVHLGLNDIPINEARKILGKSVIIGGTANTIEDILLQKDRGADYVGLGPFRHTNTKKNLSPVIGLHGYKKIINELNKLNCEIPIFAVGGIKQKDINDIRNIGIQGIAISGDILNKMIEQKGK